MTEREPIELGEWITARFDSDGDLEIYDQGDGQHTYLKPDEYLKLRDFINEHIRIINQIDSTPSGAKSELIERRGR